MEEAYCVISQEDMEKIEKATPPSDKPTPRYEGASHLALTEEVLECNLFPTKFTNKCSRNFEAQMKQLKDFEQCLKTRQREVRKIDSVLRSMAFEISHSIDCIIWNWRIQRELYTRLKNLVWDPQDKEAFEDLVRMKLKCTVENFSMDCIFTCSRINEYIRDAGLWPDYKMEDGTDIMKPVPTRLHSIRRLIRCGRIHYGNPRICSQFRDGANKFINSIEEIESDHDEIRKIEFGAEVSVQEPIDVSVECIIQQIEEAKKLPTDAMEMRIRELLAGRCNLDVYKSFLTCVTRDINVTARDMIYTRNQWHWGRRQQTEKTQHRESERDH